MTPSPGLVLCVGYDGHVCVTLLTVASGRRRCRACERSMDLNEQVMRAGLDGEPPIIYCECGGVADYPEHVLSLMHRNWLRAGGS